MSASIRHFGVTYRGRTYEIVKIDVGGRSAEVCVSPTGRSVRIYVDGNEVPK